MNNSADMLILNGIDFLEKSLGEFKEQPKYSIIHFAISVEILLKARLAIEHWSLIVNKEPNKKKYDLGDFVSVNLDETVKRLRNVVGENISEAEYSSFKKLQHIEIELFISIIVMSTLIVEALKMMLNP